MRLGRPILAHMEKAFLLADFAARAHSHIRGKGKRIATRVGVFEIGRVGHVQEATRHNHLGQHTTTEGLDLLPGVAQESIAGPATEQYDGVHWYAVEVHCHGCQRAKGVEANALWVEAQAFKINARDETLEHLQGGHGVEVACTFVVALELVDKIGF